MSTSVPGRDYSLTGPEAQRAVERGLAGAQWYQCPVPRKRLKELMQRRDGPAIRDSVIWLGALALSGWLGAHFWGGWAAVPFFLVYGVLYGSASDSRWHECSHGTAFRTAWLNDLIYYLASFMVLREPTVWRWSHTRHHSDTLVVGRDREIAAKRPPNFLELAGTLLALPGARDFFAKLAVHCLGRLQPEEAGYIPASEHRKVFWTARAFAAVWLAAIGAAVALHSWLPLMFVGLPSFYGAWLMPVWGFTQHAGLAEDVLDHRLNCRTVYMNPIIRFLYWNMNYHVEHHMFPMVPYHALPALHAEIKADCPPPYPSLAAAWGEIIPALLRQAQDPTYYVPRPLPAPAPAVAVAAG